MKYSIEVRTKTPEAYLIDSSQAAEINEAFQVAQTMRKTHGDGHFAQIKDETGEVVAAFGKDTEIKS